MVQLIQALAAAPWLHAPASTSGVGAFAAPPAPTVGPPLNIRQLHAPTTAAAAAAAAQSLSGYAFLGCYLDTTTRLLTEVFTTLERNTPQVCCELCLNLNTTYQWCGLENSDNCFCGAAPAWSSLVPLPSASCNSGCPGGGSTTCGGVWAIDLYSATEVTTTTGKPTGPLTTAAVPGYTAMGCFTDGGNRVLSAVGGELLLNNPQFCCEWCVNVNEGYQWCGVEDGAQCFCDSTTSKGALAASAGDCSSFCWGSAGAACGGAGRINLYSATAVITTSDASTQPASTNAGATSPVPTPKTTTTGTPGSSQDSSSGGGDGGLSGGAIAGIVIGVLAAAALAGAAFWWFTRRRRLAGTLGWGTNGAGPAVSQNPLVELGPGKAPAELDPYKSATPYSVSPQPQPAYGPPPAELDAWHGR